MSTNTLTVELGERSYPIYIGEAIHHQAEFYRRHITGRQVMVVTNETIAPLYLDETLSALSGYDVATIILPDGEQYKTLETLNKVFTGLLEHRFTRKATLVALGGGVIGDITGVCGGIVPAGDSVYPGSDNTAFPSRFICWW